jgi:hypothetical protein
MWHSDPQDTESKYASRIRMRIQNFLKMLDPDPEPIRIFNGPTNQEQTNKQISLWKSKNQNFHMKPN